MGKALTIFSLYLDNPREGRDSGFSAIKWLGHNIIYKNLHKYFLVTNRICNMARFSMDDLLGPLDLAELDKELPQGF